MARIAVLLCALLCWASGQQQDNDDGQYHPELHEAPYQETNQLTSGYQAAPRQQYRPAAQPQYRAQSQGSYADPRNAAILSEARYLSGDGTFGASYTQEDGVEFKEESQPDGSRKGQYSWVDPSGQRRTVTYTAGKDGFQASGDHLPQGPVGSQQQPAQAQPQYRAPAPQQAQPQYRPAPQQAQAQYRPAPQQAQPQYRPAPQPVYETQPQYRPAPQQAQPQYRPAPQQAQPQYRPQARVQEAPVDPNAGTYSISANF